MTTEADVLEALRRCYDPCCRDRGISVVDMGLVEEIHIEGSEVAIDMVLTTGWCPFVANLHQTMIDEVSRLPGVESVSVDVVWDPVWTMDRMSEQARQQLTMPLEPLLPYREQRIERERSAT